MKTRIIRICLLATLLLFAASAYGQKQIEVKVVNEAEIKVKLYAARENTSVSLLGGTVNKTDTEITIGTEWSSTITVKVDKLLGSIRFQGDIIGFSCSDNKQKITGIDVSGNPDLVMLDCENNAIRELNIDKNINIEELTCGYTQISSLNLEYNTQLRKLRCQKSNLTDLNLAANGELKVISCWGNSAITSLDLSNLDNLTYLDCSNTGITSLDVSKLENLERLYCSNPGLTSLDLPANTSLKTLNCSNTGITSLDVSENKNLEYLYCSNTGITSLDVSKLEKLTYLYCYSCPFTADALDRIYCDLNQEEGGIYIIDSEKEDEYKETVEASSGSILKSKNWSFFSYDTQRKNAEDITSTYKFAGTFDCSSDQVLIAFHPDLLKEEVEILVDGEKLEGAKHVPSGSEVILKPVKEGSEIKTFVINGEEKTGSSFKAESDKTKVFSISNIVLGDKPKSDDKTGANPVESALLASVRVAPNPCSTQLTVYNVQSVQSYALISPVGRVVLSSAHDGSSLITINTSSLPAGVNLLRLEARDGVKVLKVVRE